MAPLDRASRDESYGNGSVASILKDSPRARDNGTGRKCPLLILRHWTEHAKNIAVEMLSGNRLPNGCPFVTAQRLIRSFHKVDVLAHRSRVEIGRAHV